ncbi:MAG: DegT/DnrJ/EryC1/StrS family aminotransferase [Elusimicrobia bacterium]|nr:DegT/DnrJ/EryC1/StrS family aminotransferase [Elusimicrobiota bacterium]
MTRTLRRKARRREIGVGDFRFGPKEKRYLSQVIASNRISYGPFSRRFEDSFAKAHSCSHAVFCNSGTSALHIALAALKESRGWSDDDEVLVPSVTFVATANIVHHNRMLPVFVDVDPRTYTLDPALIEAKLTRRTRAIIPVHLMGLPADMDPILAIAKAKGLEIIEDACEAPFASYRGRKVGSLGAIGCFSTYVAHFIVTGVGGLATTNDPDLAVRLRSLMNHGRDSIYLSIDDDDASSGRELHEIVAKRFRFVSMGHSFRCTEFEAAVGLAQLEQTRPILEARRRNARQLSEGLADLQDVLQLPYQPTDREHVYMLYPLILRGADKRPLVNHLEDRGIETRDIMPLINQPVYRRLHGDLEPSYPVARWMNRCGFYLGCHQYLTAPDMAYVVEQIRGFFGRGRR